MTVWFVGRHPGAKEWAVRQGLAIDAWIEHLTDQAVAGDTVIGTLPINRVAALNQIGVRYINLSLDLPMEWRGKELDYEMMQACKPCLELFDVRILARVDASDSKAVQELLTK